MEGKIEVAERCEIFALNSLELHPPFSAFAERPPFYMGD